jgi:ketosteroid isomerase-like protein
MRNWTLKTGVLALAIVAMGAGCATGGGGGMSDEEAIAAQMAKFQAAMIALDLDSAFVMVADDFEMSDGLGKDEYKEFLTQLKDAGQFDGVEFSTDDLVVVVDGKTAEAGPMLVEGAFGAATLEFELEKRDGEWVVVYINQIVG